MPLIIYINYITKGITYTPITDQVTKHNNVIGKQIIFITLTI